MMMLRDLGCSWMILACIINVLLSTCLASDGDSLVATINQNGINGSFSVQQINSSTVKITMDLQFEGVENKTYAIHSHPTNYQDNCVNVGPIVFDISNSHGHKRKQEVWYDSVNITTFGRNSIQGRSFVISDTQKTVLACGTLLSTGTSNNAYAVAAIASNKIAGKFEFIQQGAGVTVITGQISHADNTNVASGNHRWYISSSVATTCPGTFDTTNIFEPDLVTGNCTRMQEQSCKVGDLLAKHGALEVGDAGSKRVTFIDTNLQLSAGAKSIYHRQLIVTETNSSTVIGCGLITLRGPLAAETLFNAVDHKGISGSVKFSQNSPYHGTSMEVAFSGLEKRAGGYHVHQYPISDSVNPCSPESVGGHVNPHNINIKDSPLPGQGTADKYEIGDMSGRYGNLVNQTTYSITRLDQNLPMFGRYTLIGRSVVIHHNDATGSRMVCSDVFPKDSKKISGHLNFTRDNDLLNGYVSMYQYEQVDGIRTPTMYIVDLEYKANSFQITTKHNFHVHTFPVGNDTEAGGTCKSTGGHYNPTDVSVMQPNYGRQCNAMYPYRCEVGDTSSKVGTYDIGRGKRFFGDVNTPLLGGHTVLGRSIVFHAYNMTAPRIACADITPVEGAMSKQFTLEGRSSEEDNNRIETMKTILKVDFNFADNEMWKIAYPRLSKSEENPECYKFTFYMLDENPSKFDMPIKEISKQKEATYIPCKEPEKPSISVSVRSSVIVSILSLLLTYVLLLN